MIAKSLSTLTALALASSLGLSLIHISLTITSCACFFVPTKSTGLPSAAHWRMNPYARRKRAAVCCRSMMCTPPRAP